MTIEQYRKTMEQIEQDHHELKSVKRSLELDHAAFMQKYDAAMEQQARDCELISDLQDKLRELESGPVAQVRSAEDLEEELASSDRTKADL